MAKAKKTTAKKAAKTTKRAKAPAPRARKAAPRKAAAKASRKAPRARKAAAPPRLRTITPYLAVNDAAAAIAWYKKVFGAKPVGETMPAPGGKIMHAMLRIGESDLMLSDIFPGSDLVDPAKAGPSVNLHYDRPNADQVWTRALDNGAKATMPFTDQFWGDTYGKLIDPFGHSWAIARRSKLSKAELEKLRQKAMAEFASMGG